MRVAPEYRGGSGDPLLLLHGFTDTWRAWTPLLGHLEPHHEVLAPTLPGHHGGDVLPPDRELTVEAATDRLEERMDAVGWDTAHIAGSSFGGWLALELARREGAFGELTGIACPVRIAYGERDWLIPWPTAYERLERMLPDVEYVELPDCGHLPMWDEPELVARTILDQTSPPT